MDSNIIDYTDKIRNFQAIVDNYNEEIAFNYLTKADWDESKAAQLFFNETTSNRGNTNTNIKSESLHYSEDISQSNNLKRKINSKSRSGYNELDQSDNEINVNLIGNNENGRRQAEQEQQGLFKRFVINPLVYVSSFFCSRRGDQISEEESRIFSELPERISNTNSFNTIIKSRIGILVLYQNTDYEYFTSFVNNVKKEEHIMDILRVNFVIYPVLSTSSEGKRLISLISEHILYPAMIFAYNKRENNTFNRASIIDRLEGQVTVDVFRDTLIRNLEIKERMANNKNVSATASIIQQQKEEIEHLEKMEREKKKVELEKKIKEDKEKEEKKRIAEEIENKKLIKQKCLPEEPSSENKMSTHIIFRYPDGNRRVERRFLKNDKIQILYDYVDSLGPDVFTESDKFELIQPFPFKSYSNSERTLEEEKLFPNAVLQIKEI